MIPAQCPAVTTRSAYSATVDGAGKNGLATTCSPAVRPDHQSLTTPSATNRSTVLVGVLSAFMASHWENG